jgi:nucleotide-binding universal stress UspA family protein
LYEKILLPLDGSDLAQQAIPYAEKLAGSLGSQIKLVHVRAPHEDKYSNMHKLYLQKIAEAVKSGAEQYVDKPGKDKITVQSTILTGDPAQEIVDYANKENIDLIVMSTHGRTGITRWALGSVADRVLRATRKPLALIRAKDIRPNTRPKNIINKILVTLDGSAQSEVVIPYVEDLASRIKAEVVLLHVLEPSYYVFTVGGFNWDAYSEKQRRSMKAFYTDYLQGIADKFRKMGITTKYQVAFGIVAEVIIDFSDKVHADFVAMSTHGRSGVNRWVLGSVTERVLRAGNTSLFLVRESGAKTE